MDQLKEVELAMGVDKLAYEQPRSIPYDEIELKFMVPPEPAQQSDDASRNPHIEDGGYFETLDNTNGGSDNFYPVVASISQSEV